MLTSWTTAEALRELRDEYSKYFPRVMSKRKTEDVRRRLSSERFTVFLGSGVSHTVGIPTWEPFVDALVKRIFAEEPELQVTIGKTLLEYSVDPLRQVQQLSELLKFRSDLLEHIQACLYSPYDRSREHILLEPICKRALLGRSSVRISNVVTYNFDDSLEACLDRLGATYHVVFDPQTYSASPRGLKIFHPHGYIRRPKKKRGGGIRDVVFGERDYLAQYASTTQWTNLTQLHHMQSRSCLFIGLSLNDPNMRRLLSLQEAHPAAASLRHLAIQSVSDEKAKNYLLERQLARLGVETLWVSSHSEVPTVITKCFR